MDLGSLRRWSNKLFQFFISVRIITHSLDFGVLDTAVSNIVQSCVVEQNAVLRHDSYVGPQIINLHFTDVLTVDENLALVSVVKSV